MKGFFKILFLAILVFAATVVKAQNVDTLLPKLKTVKDEDKPALLVKIADAYMKSGDLDKALENYKIAADAAHDEGKDLEEGVAWHGVGKVHYARKEYKDALPAFQKAVEIREPIKDLDGLGKSYNNIGIINSETGKYDEAIEYYKKAIVVKEQLGDLTGKAKTLQNIANVYNQQGKFEQAISYNQQALEVFKKVDFKEGIYAALNSIGVAYCNFGVDKYQAALQFEQDAAKIAEEMKNPKYMAESYANIGNTIFSMEDDSIKKGKIKRHIKQRFAIPLSFYLKALDLRTTLGNKREIANSLGNIGIIYRYREDYAKALDYYNRSLALNLELNNQFESAINYKEMGLIYMEENNISKSEEYLKKGLEISRQIKAKSLEKSICIACADLYAKVGDYKKAYDFKVLDSQLQDSLWSEQSNKSIADMQTKYDTEKIQHAKELSDKVNENQKRIIWIGVAVLFIILMALIIVFRLYGQIRKKNVILKEQKAEIEAQRDEIEKQRDVAEKQRDMISEQKKEIMDSIHYAQRIQSALLPKTEIIAKQLPDHFVLFRPRDIVSGDFFWHTFHDNKIVIAAADCTGHGVPGAFMSVLGVSLLNEIVKRAEVPSPNLILDRLREAITTTLSQSASSSTSTEDGMDIAMCVVDLETMKLQYAGAHNQLYMIRRG